MEIFESSQEVKEIPEMEPDTAIVRTPLLPHQKQGLYFMSRKEHAGDSKEEEVKPDKDGNVAQASDSLWRLAMNKNGRSFWRNIITGTTQLEKPRLCQGGIFADMMGLGKTLTVISLIASTLSASRRWAETAPRVTAEDGFELTNLPSTLLVAPLSVIANWEEQVKAHTVSEKLSIYVYHSKNRETDLNKLAQYQIIITTYSIVSSELHGVRTTRKANTVSPFRAANFFRIVLDEAHAIREPTTLQSRAICALESPRRWAVTGTPIQNRLEDFGSLIRFIRLSDVDTHFHQSIIRPFKMADPNIVPVLRVLVDSITLRRTKETLNLPKRTDEVVKLILTPQELKLYQWFAVDGRRKAQAIVAQAGITKKWQMVTCLSRLFDL